MRTTRQPARPVAVVLRCGSPTWPNATHILGEGRTLAAALKAARRGLASFQPLPGSVYVRWPVGNGFDHRITPLVFC